MGRSGEELFSKTLAVFLILHAVFAASNEVVYRCERKPDGAECINIHPKFRNATIPPGPELALIVNAFIMVPYNDSYPFSRAHIEPAVNQALRDEGAESCTDSRNTAVCVSITFVDTQCDSHVALGKASDIRTALLVNGDQCGYGDRLDTMNLFVGPTCDRAAESVSVLASHWNMTVILPGARSTRFDEKTPPCCDTVTRTGHSASDVGRFISRLSDEKGWYGIRLVYTRCTNHGAPVDHEVFSDCTTLMQGISTTLQAQHKNSTVSMTSFPSDQNLVESAGDLLDDISSTATMSLWCVGRKTMHYILDQATELGMDRNHQFVYLDLYNTENVYAWDDEDDQDVYKEPEVTLTDPGRSLNGLHIVSLYKPDTKEYRNFSDEMKRMQGNAAGGTDVGDGFVNPFVAQYYNAIRLLVRTLKTAVNTSTIDGHDFTRLLWNSSFQSIDGTVQINENGDRQMDYTLMAQNAITGNFENVIIYYGYNDSLVEIAVDEETSQDPNDLVLAWLVIIIIVITLLLIVLLWFLLGRIRLKRYRLVNARWRVRYRQLKWPSEDSEEDTPTVTRKIRRRDTRAKSQFQRTRMTETVIWKGVLVAYKEFLTVSDIKATEELVLEMDRMLSLRNQHICRFIGAGFDEPVFMLTEYCSRGSVQDFLYTASFHIDDDFKNCLISDIARGMQYLHHSSIKIHGNLKLSNCLLNDRYVVKLTDFGPKTIMQKQARHIGDEEEYSKGMLCTAPELLRQSSNYIGPTQEGDIYSFAVAIHEILYRRGVFYLGQEMRYSYAGIIRLVKTENSFRPTLEDDVEVVLGNERKKLLQNCWCESPHLRPTFDSITNAMASLYRQEHIVNNLVERLERHAESLERRVADVTNALNAEKDNAEQILSQMLPKNVLESVKKGKEIQPESFECATIYFSDIVGFDDKCNVTATMDVINALNEFYVMFDNAIDSFDVYKVETISDSYVVVSGLPNRNGRQHASEISRMALKLMQLSKDFIHRYGESGRLHLRVGIHSGPVVAGVIAQKMRRYCLFGDTVNTAARMKQTGKPLQIQVSPATKQILDMGGESNEYELRQRKGEVFLKGIGNWQTWWLEKKGSLDSGALATPLAHTTTTSEYSPSIPPTTFLPTGSPSLTPVSL